MLPEKVFCQVGIVEELDELLRTDAGSAVVYTEDRGIEFRVGFQWELEIELGRHQILVETLVQ